MMTRLSLKQSPKMELPGLRLTQTPHQRRLQPNKRSMNLNSTPSCRESTELLVEHQMECQVVLELVLELVLEVLAQQVLELMILTEILTNS